MCHVVGPSQCLEFFLAECSRRQRSHEWDLCDAASYLLQVGLRSEADIALAERLLMTLPDDPDVRRALACAAERLPVQLTAALSVQLRSLASNTTGARVQRIRRGRNVSSTDGRAFWNVLAVDAGAYVAVTVKMRPMRDDSRFIVKPADSVYGVPVAAIPRHGAHVADLDRSLPQHDVSLQDVRHGDRLRIVSGWWGTDAALEDLLERVVRENAPGLAVDLWPEALADLSAYIRDPNASAPLRLWMLCEELRARSALHREMLRVIDDTLASLGSPAKPSG